MYRNSFISSFLLPIGLQITETYHNQLVFWIRIQNLDFSYFITF